MLSAVFFAISVLAQGANLQASPIVRRIEIEGNFRFPRETVLAWLSETPGKPVSAMQVRQDLERLHRTGFLRSVEVESRDVSPGFVDLVYRVRERPFVSAFSVAGVDDALGDLIRQALRKENLEIRPGSAYRPDRTMMAARAVRRMIGARKHPMADVEVMSEQRGGLVQVALLVNPGPRIEIGTVEFRGNESIPAGDLLRRMGNSRPALLLGLFSGEGRYAPDELETNLESVRRLYRSRGFASVTVGKPEVVTRAFPARRHPLAPWDWRESQKIAVSIPVKEGPVYTARSVRIDGDAGQAESEVTRLMQGLGIPGRYDYGSLESVREKMLAALGHQGYAFARVDLEQRYDAVSPEVDVTYRVRAGTPALVRRIEFTGNPRLPDRILRRELLVKEGDIYDCSRLDKSIQKLNRSGLIQEMRRDDVELRSRPGRDTIDLVFKVRERNRQGVFGTGGTGGSAGGYLGIIYTAFNLLGLGEKLSFELDGGAAQSNTLLDLAMNHFMGGPFSLGLSLAHRVTGLNASSIVPGPGQVAGFLKIRSTGGALRGTYQINSRVGVGLGMEVERESSLAEDAAENPGDWKTTPRATIQPSLFIDSTGGAYRPVRGVQLLWSPAWSAPSTFAAADTVQQSARLRVYSPDPFSRGRNQLAFQFVGAATRPLGGSGLPIERRLFPADELLRGFAHGAVSPWTYDPSLDSDRRLQPAGADTVLGASSEYRIPIFGAISGAAFADIGWIGLNRSSVAAPAAIVAKTNHLLRVSTGGELRVLIPGLRQPARLIFAWNPLRLNALFTGDSGSRVIADPARSIRFALGNVF